MACMDHLRELQIEAVKKYEAELEKFEKEKAEKEALEKQAKVDELLQA